MEPTVTISVNEYDALRKIRDAVKSKGPQYIRYEEYSSCIYVTTDKTEFIASLIKNLEKTKEYYNNICEERNELRRELNNIHESTRKKSWF